MAKMAKKSKSANGATKSKQRRVRVEWSKGHPCRVKEALQIKDPG